MEKLYQMENFYKIKIEKVFQKVEQFQIYQGCKLLK